MTTTATRSRARSRASTGARTSVDRRGEAQRRTRRHQPSRAPMADSHDAAVDAYIDRAKPFAQPILKRIRAVMHRACPGVSETIKWGMPAFEFKGPLAGMAAFKEHCVLGFWKGPLLKDRTGALERGHRTAMGDLGCLRSLRDLPSASTLASLVKQAAALNEAGTKVPRDLKARREIPMPADLAKALRGNRRALATFDALAPSHKREYLEWIVEAKRQETRTKRIATALTWLSQGKRRNWKYESRKR